MADNFDLKKFLIENKQTFDSKRVNTVIKEFNAQTYIEKKYGQEVLRQVYDDLTGDDEDQQGWNTWDSLISSKDTDEIDSIVRDYLQGIKENEKEETSNYISGKDISVADLFKKVGIDLNRPVRTETDYGSPGNVEVKDNRDPKELLKYLESQRQQILTDPENAKEIEDGFAINYTLDPTEVGYTPNDESGFKTSVLFFDSEDVLIFQK